MRGFIILFLVFFINTSLVVNADTVYKTARLIDNGYINDVPKSSIKKLAEIENALYGQAYIDQALLARIERLENTVYHRYYPSSPIDERLDNLIYNYNYGRNNRITRTNRIKRIVDTINSTFIGAPTGFTPPIGWQY